MARGAGGTKNRKTTFCKVEHHAWSSPVPFSVRFVSVSSIPFLLASRPQKWPTSLRKFWSIICNIEIIRLDQLFLHSSHPLDFGRKLVALVAQPLRLSPCEVQLLETCEKVCGHFLLPVKNLWITGRNRFPRHIFLMIVRGSRFRKLPWFVTYMSRQVSPLLQPIIRQNMHISAFLENPTLRRVLNFLLPSRQVFL